MTESKLFCVLPDYVCTPDGMAIDRYGNLVLSCPNYAQDDLSGCVVKIDKDGNVKKWFDVPVHPETGVARNMGIAFDDDWNVYLCDNQGWSEREELLFKGRVLKVTVDDDGNILKSTVVAEHMEHPNGIRIRGGYMYVTQSYLHPVHREDGKLVSCVYRFRLDEENVQITNTLEDPNIFATFITHNPDCQYGADGIVFDKEGNLYVGNFGDGAVYRLTFNEDGSLNLNPNSRTVRTCYVEPSLAQAEAYDRFQFVRQGYFCVDSKDSRPEALVFNRIVSLKSSFRLPK